MRNLLGPGQLEVDVSLHHLLLCDFVRNNLFKETLFHLIVHLESQRGVSTSTYDTSAKQPVLTLLMYLTLAPALQRQLHLL